MNYIELPKEAAFTPIYSPRTTLSRTHAELDRLTTNLAINIDKYILGFFKDAFEMNQGQMSKEEFISQGLKHLKSWQRQIKHRKEKLHLCLAGLFEEADSSHRGAITWSQFNSMLIEKSLNLKSLRSQQPGNTTLMRQLHISGGLARHGSNPVQKMVYLNNKIALFTEESSQVHFYNLDGSVASLKPLVLSQQSLTVETSISKRTKLGKKQVLKKDLVVAQYKNVLLDMIYISDGKYDLLITSSTDFIIRGWDVSGNIPGIGKQPENEDEKMVHQFSQEIYTMAWDHVNQILYCGGKSPIIHEWMVKTDSERDLACPDGHSEMISAMIMMPKLQFLATGGYDGKLILWDTISQTKKFKYKEHTRSISAMAFHQGLILLFTAAYDHSICVWNPYIQSLVHKIINNTNAIQLDIIPSTNLLIAMDSQSNVRIREINKFTLVSSFSLAKHENRSEPTCMVSSPDPLRYYFGGLTVNVYEYIHIDVNVIMDSTALCLKYEPSTFTLYCPVKNHVVGWDLLTGNIAVTLRNLTNSEITAFGTFSLGKSGVIGDNEGNVVLRKLQNGVLIKQLYKHKSNVTALCVEQLSRHKLIFSCSFDGQIAIFQKDLHGDFNYLKSLSVKKINPSSSVSTLCYQAGRHTLILGTSSGQILCMDIDKNKLISRCETSGGDIQRFILLAEDNILLSFSKKAQIFGFYLPPHIKKFKPACHLISESSSSRVSSVEMSISHRRAYLGFENGELMCLWLGGKELQSDTYSEDKQEGNTIRHLWRSNFGENIRALTLIQGQDTLVVLVGNNNVVLVACESGDQVAQLNQKYQQNEPPPILFLNQQTDSVYVKSQDIFVPVKAQGKDQQIRRYLDPSFYLNQVEAYHNKISTVSNPHWKFYPSVQNHSQAIISKTLQLLSTVQAHEQKPKKLRLVKPDRQEPFDLQAAAELPRRWERQKYQEEEFVRSRTGKQQSVHFQRVPTGQQASQMSSSGIRLTKNSRYSKSTQKLGLTNQGKQLDRANSINNPLYKLGLALRSVNQHDSKALKLMEMAEKQTLKTKSTLKLPRIGPLTSQKQ